MVGLNLSAVNLTYEHITLGIFLRTMFVWWCVKYWAGSRYRTDLQSTLAGDYESEPAARSAKRSLNRNLKWALIFRWCCGAVLIVLSASGMLQYASPRDVVVLIILLTAGVVFVAAMFAAAELSASKSFRTFFNVLGWLLATAIVSVFCASHIRGGHPVSLVQDCISLVVGYPMSWILGLAGFFVMFPVGDWIGRFMLRWAADVTPEEGLPDGGKWIGRLERLLIVLCLVAGQPAGIAILVTAKGALRYGEIRHGIDDGGDQRKLIEYILIGSMLSYASALAVGWLVSGAWTLMPPMF